jgi:Mrp family chromosome partitioning ATPase
MSSTVIPQLFGLSPDRGLAEALAGTANVWDVARRPANYARLRVITPGLDTSRVLYDFQHDVNRALIADLRRQASMVIIEAPATAGSSDTFALAEFADAALIVAEVGNTTRPEIAEALQRLDRLHTPVLGATLVPRFGPTAGQPGKILKADERGTDRTGQSAQVHAGEQPGRTASGAPRLPMPGQPSRERDLSETAPIPLAVQLTGNDNRGTIRVSGLESAEPSASNTEG